MPITGTNNQLAVLDWDQDYEVGLPVAPDDPFGTDNQLQLLWLPLITITSLPVFVYCMAASYETTIALTGSYSTTISITGTVEEC